MLCLLLESSAGAFLWDMLPVLWRGYTAELGFRADSTHALLDTLEEVVMKQWLQTLWLVSSFSLPLLAEAGEMLFADEEQTNPPTCGSSR